MTEDFADELPAHIEESMQDPAYRDAVVTGRGDPDEALSEQLAEAVMRSTIAAGYLDAHHIARDLVPVVEAHVAAQVEAAVSVWRQDWQGALNSAREWKGRAEAAEAAVPAEGTDEGEVWRGGLSNVLPAARGAALGIAHKAAARAEQEKVGKAMTGPPVAPSAYDTARYAIGALSTPSGFVLGDVIARTVLDSGAVIPAPVSSGEALPATMLRPVGCICGGEDGPCTCEPAPVVTPSAEDGA